MRDVVTRTPGASRMPGGTPEPGDWWARLAIDIAHRLARNVVQEYAHLLNLPSVEEPLQTRFLPVPAPPFMNGGPADFLSWVIECRTGDFIPDKAAERLEWRLLRPVDDPGERHPAD